MEDFQDYIVRIDALGRYRRAPGYGKKYTRNLLERIKKSQGILILAVSGPRIVGMITGMIMPKLSKLKLLEFHPAKRGKILELFLYPEFRKQGLGKKLMQEMERYFRKKKCDWVYLGVLPSNQARGFYRNLGYRESDIDMMKLLK